ncbi:MAG TPA: A24 family peptidase [Pseudobacteroides sp.]|uniref:prepilin peptidase n=1 Tax=Pseudobacteroides sp. TaxID=1968840 RepID=UPI002F94D667
MAIVLLSIFSLFLGVLLNIIASRIPKVVENDIEDVTWAWPFCRSCSTKLKPLQMLFPINLFLHHGRCGKCESKIFGRPIQITLFALVVCVLLYLKFDFTIQFFAFLYLMSVLIAVFFIDMDYYIIPDDLLFAGLGGALLVFVYNLFYEFPIYMDRAWWNPVLGGASVSLVLLLIGIVGLFIYKTEAMGLGDVKLFIPIGIFLGWRMVIVSFILSAIIGSLISIVMMIIRRKKLREAIPFGPAIVLGTLATILYGTDILNWYLQFNNY